jgi:hypothetical protein
MCLSITTVFILALFGVTSLLSVMLKAIRWERKALLNDWLISSSEQGYFLAILSLPRFNLTAGSAVSEQWRKSH